jgi:hypothetical protein
MMTLPNFLILGAPKCGTTSLYSYLGQHPEVFMSFPKEPTFFGHEGEDGLFNGPGDNNEIYRTRMITNLDAYSALFNGVTTQKAVGEASTFYLYLPKAVLRIKKYIPEAKMFAVLRNPADRAYSNYLHLVRQLREPCTFTQALREEPSRIKNNWNEFWHYKSMGFYSQQVKRYYDTFGRQQVHIYLHEDLQKDPLSLVKRIFEILQVDSSFIPDMSKKWNVGYMPKNPIREKFFYKLKNMSHFSKRHLPWRLRAPIRKTIALIGRLERPDQVPRPAMPHDLRDSLLEDYREDILKLEELLQRDLSHWLSPVPASAAATSD